MSHYCVYVFHDGGSYEHLLAPYNENLNVEPYRVYTREEAIAESKSEVADTKIRYDEYNANPQKYMNDRRLTSDSSHILFLRDEFPERLRWSDDEYYEHIAQRYTIIHEDGSIWSTYNPDSKWDWYGEGWGGALHLKSGEESDEALVGDVNFHDREGVPFAFITTDGVWHERGQMGWFACVSNEKEEKIWENEFYEYVDSLDEDIMVTVIDCHI